MNENVAGMEPIVKMNQEQIRKIIEKVEKSLPIVQNAIQFCRENETSSRLTSIENEVTLFYYFDKDSQKAKDGFAQLQGEEKSEDIFDTAERIWRKPYSYEADLLYSEFSAGIGILCNTLNLRNPLNEFALPLEYEKKLLRCKAVIETAKSLLI